MDAPHPPPCPARNDVARSRSRAGSASMGRVFGACRLGDHRSSGGRGVLSARWVSCALRTVRSQDVRLCVGGSSHLRHLAGGIAGATSARCHDVLLCVGESSHLRHLVGGRAGARLAEGSSAGGEIGCGWLRPVRSAAAGEIGCGWRDGLRQARCHDVLMCVGGSSQLRPLAVREWQRAARPFDKRGRRSARLLLPGQLG